MITKQIDREKNFLTTFEKNDDSECLNLMIKQINKNAWSTRDRFTSMIVKVRLKHENIAHKASNLNIFLLLATQPLQRKGSRLRDYTALKISLISQIDDSGAERPIKRE